MKINITYNEYKYAQYQLYETKKDAKLSISNFKKTLLHNINNEKFMYDNCINDGHAINDIIYPTVFIYFDKFKIYNVFYKKYLKKFIVDIYKRIIYKNNNFTTTDLETVKLPFITALFEYINDNSEFLNNFENIIKKRLSIILTKCSEKIKNEYYIQLENNMIYILIESIINKFLKDLVFNKNKYLTVIHNDICMYFTKLAEYKNNNYSFIINLRNELNKSTCDKNNKCSITMIKDFYSNKSDKDLLNDVLMNYLKRFEVMCLKDNDFDNFKNHSTRYIVVKIINGIRKIADPTKNDVDISNSGDIEENIDKLIVILNGLIVDKKLIIDNCYHFDIREYFMEMIYPKSYDLITNFLKEKYNEN